MTKRTRDRLARLSAFLLITGYLGTTMPVPGQAVSCSTANVTVQRISASVMYVDTGISPQLRGSYVGYKVTNNGAAIADAWVQINGFAGGVVNKATNEPGLLHVGAMPSASSSFAYFYLVASGSTSTPQSHNVVVNAGNPNFGGTEVCTQTFTITTVEETIKANANKVQTVVAGPNPAELGGIMTMTVTGATGQVGDGPPGHPNGLGVFVGTPATEPGWRADAYQLVDTSINFVGKGVYNDTLVVSGLNGKNYDYTATYTFRAVGTTVAPTSVTPVNYIASGTQIKHTDTSGYTANLQPIQPTENKLQLSKSANPTQLPATGGTVVYTVTLTNNGTLPSSLDDFQDVLPAGAAYVAGSSKFKGGAIPDPFVSGQTLTWVGTFGAAGGGGTAKLTYSATLPGTAGTYVNSAVGHVRTTQIDTTLLTTDSSPATASVQVGVLDAPPVANDDTVNTPEDTVKVISVLTNDTDPNNNIDPTKVTIPAGQGPTKGTASPNNDGTITYTPAQDQNGQDTFTYQVCDTTTPTPLCDTATVTVNISAVEDPPKAVDDGVETNENTAATWNLISNDTDPENNISASTFSIVSGPTHGTLSNVGNGSVTYTPTTGYSGTDSLVYEICDSTGLCDTGTVSITVNNVNEAPVANADAISTPEDVPVTINVAANDTDPDGNLDPTSVSIPAGKEPTNGTAVVNIDGTITYTPAQDFYGVDSFEYTICDSGTPKLCSTASALVTTTVVQVDDPPNAENDSFTILEDAAATTLDLVANDSDPDPAATGGIDPATLKVISGPSHGTVTNNLDGTVAYTPDQNFNGTDSFTYEVCDKTGLCDTATVGLTISAQPDPPRAVDDAVETNQDTAATWNLIANDLDPEDNIDPASFSIVVGSGPTWGTLSNVANGSVTYTPNAGFFGDDSFEYQICDTTNLCDTATVKIGVNNVPKPPVASDQSVSTNEDSNTTWNLNVADTDLDWSTLTIINGPSNGTVTLNGGGSVTYAPKPDFNGTDSFTYEVCDTTGLCDTATVSLTVVAQPDAPVARADAAATGEDNAVTIDVVANDTDPDGDLDKSSVSVTADPTNGTITAIADGKITYKPNANFNGTDSFTYQVCDTTSPTRLCHTATVSIDVEAVNDLPTPKDDAFTIDEDAAATNLDLAGNDTDPDDKVGAPDVVASSLTILSGPANGTATNKGDGTVDYTPDKDFNGTDKIVYQVCDKQGECATATATITVTPKPDAPVAKNDSATTPEDTAVTVNVLANDSDIDGADDLDLTKLTIVTGPSKGTATANGDGTITYTPAENDTGTYDIVYQICDKTVGTPLCATATLKVTVTAEDDPPVANDDTLTVDEDGTETIDVTANDTDPDGAAPFGNLDRTAVTIISAPSEGTATVALDGTVTYVPKKDYSGSDSFTYQVCDTTGLCDTATVAVTVNGAADAPVTENDDATVSEDSSVTVDVAFNDSDPDGDLDPASVSIVSGPSNGVASAVGDGTITYTPTANWHGTDTITYQICDKSAPPLCEQGTLTIEVTSVPDLPTVVDDSALTAEDSPVAIDVLGNDSDADNDLDSGSVTVTVQPVAGSVSVNPTTGVITYYPPADWSGNDSFTYQVCDSTGECGTGTVSVVVYPVNDVPTVVADTATVAEDGSVLIPVISNDSDIDNALDPQSVTIASPPAHGTASVNPVTGVISYTPDANFNGTDGFTYRICDVAGGCSTATVIVNVTPVNDAPIRLDPETVEIMVKGTPFPVLFSDPESDVYSVKLISGNLPPGLQLNPDGSFSGRAEQDGTYIAGIEVCDIHGACSQSTLTIEVGAAALVLLPFTGLAMGGIGLIGLLLMLAGTLVRKLGDEDHPEADVRM